MVMYLEVILFPEVILKKSGNKVINDDLNVSSVVNLFSLRHNFLKPAELKHFGQILISG